MARAGQWCRGAWAPKALVGLLPVLEQWVGIMRDPYWNQDCPWWYGERALVSTLAGAAWRVNARAFEEYSATKGFGSEAYAGRADLWIQRYRTSFVAEAKLTWVSLGVRTKTVDRRLRDWAGRDAQRHARDKAKPISLLFVVPYAPSPEGLGDRCRSFIERLGAELGHDVARAWLFRRNHFPEHGSYHYPGVVLLARLV